MFRSFIVMLALAATAAPVFAQTGATSGQTTRRQTTTTTTTNTTTTPPATEQQTTETPAPRSTRRTRNRRTTAAADAAAATAVRAAFDALLDGIRSASVEQVMGVYWNSPQLLIFNNNGTVTRTWEQVRSNRTSSYPNVKDVKLDVRDVRVQVLGADAALVTALWTQSQTYKNTPESSTGRMTLIFRNIDGTWKVVHTHTSPDAPDPSRLMPSEQRETTTTTTTTTTKTPPPSKP